MSASTREADFEAAIIDSLVAQGGYEQGWDKDFNPELALDEKTLFRFIKTSQPQAWQKLSEIHQSKVEEKFLARLIQELANSGTLAVLRNGLTDYGVRFKLAYFKPASTLNPETLAQYEQNILTVTQQVHYSLQNRNAIDLLLSVNGLPVATVELKNQFSGQTVEDAKAQYKNDRDPRELLFRFKQRAVVHFAVDTDAVWMTTHLRGKKTYFLPFNKGHNGGAGNPPQADNYRTAYLWEDVWAKDSWLDILGRFIYLEAKEEKVDGRTKHKEALIFPRYHQLQAVRNLVQRARAQGPGENYLIQHSAGSGKSYTIAWLSYQLASLYNQADARIFDSVIVVTDRRVLDQQLQETIFQFERTAGVVQKIEKDSAQLAQAISTGRNIIITTLQKFPFILDKVADLPQRRYAIIVDEAHSSQGGGNGQKDEGSPQRGRGGQAHRWGGFHYGRYAR